MSNGSKKEYLQEIQERYWFSPRKEQGIILYEFCCICDYNRKYAIRILNMLPEEKKSQNKKRRGTPKRYLDEHLLQFLRQLWEATDLACSKTTQGDDTSVASILLIDL